MHVACFPASIIIGQQRGYDLYRQIVTQLICEILSGLSSEHAFRALSKDLFSPVEWYESVEEF